MNIMPDGTGWILPPRCAARYTMGVMWRYGVQSLSYHDIDPEMDVSRIIMNVRNPFTRIRSWLRLWNTTFPNPIDAVEYIENLHTNKRGVQWVNYIENPNEITDPWKYIVPLHYYTDTLSKYNKEVDFFIHQERLEKDMEDAGYPTMGYEYEHVVQNEAPEDEKKRSAYQFMRNEAVPNKIDIGFRVRDSETKWEPGDGKDDLDFYLDNPHCADIIATYYKKDFETFGYTTNVGSLKV